MERVLVTGSEGMLGQALMRGLSGRRIQAFGSDIRSRENKADITDIEGISDLIDRIKPDTIIHTAAYTNVDGCELGKEKAYLVNSEGTRNVALACKSVNAFLIYISTDYVFDGKKTTPYIEKDMPNPISIYGDSKLKGEIFIKEILKDYLIIRTSWLFGRGGRNFVDIIIDKAKTEKILKVVNDQIGSPTYASDLAKAIINLRPKTHNLQPKIVNITNSGSCSWYEFANEILKTKGINGVAIKPTTSDELNRPAKRPNMSILDNRKFRNISGSLLPTWQDALKRYITARTQHPEPNTHNL